MSQSIQKILHYRHLNKYLWPILSAAILLFLSFQYARITNIPTGDDPAVHIYMIKTYSYRELISTNYPLPLFIFKYLTNLLKSNPMHLFIYLVCTFLFISSFLITLITKKISNSWLIALVAGAIFASGRWTVDGLRMGLFAESFGWIIFLFTIYSLMKKNLILTILGTALLTVSHPFSFTVFILFFTVFSLISLFSKENGDRFFIIKLVIIYLLGMIIARFALPQLFDKFLEFVNFETIGWGERTFWQVATSDQLRRIYQVIFALLGLIVLYKTREKTSSRAILALSLVGLFLAFNQIFGIRFLVFRFYPYYEMSIAILAALGLGLLANNQALPKKLNAKISSNLLLILLAVITIYPNIYVNHQITSWQAHTPSANHSITKYDLEAFAWIEQNISDMGVINTSKKRSLWMKALTSHKAFANDSEVFYDFKNAKLDYEYIYYPEWIKAPSKLTKKYISVYDKNNIRIYHKR